MSQTLNISLVAYSADDSFVFVRVPNERGRWMLVDRCVVEVDCETCASVAGEPCQRWKRWRSPGDRAFGEQKAERTGAYHIGVHVSRREAWRTKRGTCHASPAQGPKPRIRVSADELQAMYAPLPELESPVGIDIDVVVKLKELAP